MTEEKKHDDKDRKKVSDEELEDVAGGTGTIFKGSNDIEIRHGDSKKKGTHSEGSGDTAVSGEL